MQRGQSQALFRGAQWQEMKQYTQTGTQQEPLPTEIFKSFWDMVLDSLLWVVLLKLGVGGNQRSPPTSVTLRNSLSGRRNKQTKQAWREEIAYAAVQPLCLLCCKENISTNGSSYTKYKVSEVSHYLGIPACLRANVLLPDPSYILFCLFSVRPALSWPIWR